MTTEFAGRMMKEWFDKKKFSPYNIPHEVYRTTKQYFDKREENI